jgi:hypothetical protein
VVLLHGLQQGRLGARAGAVDFVGHQQLAEHRPLHEAELVTAGLCLVEHLGADNIGRHQVRGELDAFFFQPQHLAERDGELGLGKAGRADQQRVTAAEDGRQRQVDHLVLTEDDRAHGLARLDKPLGGGVQLVEDLFISIGDVAHGAVCLSTSGSARQRARRNRCAFRPSIRHQAWP